MNGCLSNVRYDGFGTFVRLHLRYLVQFDVGDDDDLLPHEQTIEAASPEQAAVDWMGAVVLEDDRADDGDDDGDVDIADYYLWSFSFSDTLDIFNISYTQPYAITFPV